MTQVRILALCATLFLLSVSAFSQAQKFDKILDDTLQSRTASGFLFINDSVRVLQFLQGDSTGFPASSVTFGKGRLIFRGDSGLYYQDLNSRVRLDSNFGAIFALKTTTITAGDGLSGGGDLSTNRTITANTKSGGGLKITTDSLEVDSTGFPATDYDVSLKLAKTDTLSLSNRINLKADSSILHTINGTSDQISVSGSPLRHSSSGSITLSLPQNIDLAADVAFKTLTLSNLASGLNGPGIAYADGVGLIEQAIVNVATGRLLYSQGSIGAAKPIWSAYPFLYSSGSNLGFGLTDTSVNKNISTTVQSSDTASAYFSFSNTGKPQLDIKGITGNTTFHADTNGIAWTNSTDTTFRARRFYASNTNTFTDRSAMATIENTDTTTHTGIESLVWMQGFARGDSGVTNMGRNGIYVQMVEDTSGGVAAVDTSRKGGFMSGAIFELHPLTENAPYKSNRDATGILIENKGRVQGTEAIYIGSSSHKDSTGQNPLRYQWVKGIEFADTAQYGLYFDGATNRAIDISTSNPIGTNPRAIVTSTTAQSDFGTMTLGGATLDSTLSVTGGGDFSRGITAGTRIGVVTKAPAVSLDLGDGTGAPAARINGAAGQVRDIYFSSASVLRWVLRGANSTAETGSNAGSDFQISGRSDAGSDLGIAFFINRSTFNTGIQTASPDSQLTVNKGAHVTRGLLIGGSLTGSGEIRGSDSFTTTATTDTVTVTGGATSDYYFIQLTGTAAPVAADAVTVEALVGKFVLHRSASGTSGLTYNWFRIK